MTDSDSSGGALGCTITTFSGSSFVAVVLNTYRILKTQLIQSLYTYTTLGTSSLLSDGRVSRFSVSFLLWTGTSVGISIGVGESIDFITGSVGEVIDFLLSLSLLEALILGKGGLLVSDFLVSWEIPVTAILTGRGCRGDGR